VLIDGSGFYSFAHSDGEAGAARAAAHTGACFVYDYSFSQVKAERFVTAAALNATNSAAASGASSSGAASSVASGAAASAAAPVVPIGGPRWCQLALSKDRAALTRAVEQAQSLGFTALVVSIDGSASAGRCVQQTLRALWRHALQTGEYQNLRNSPVRKYTQRMMNRNTPTAGCCS
jgi:hypothetical protein